MKSLWHLELVHKERLNSVKSVIIASNHISYYDPPCIASVIPFEIAFLAKAELFKNKYIGSFLRYLNAIPVKRGTADKGAIEKSINTLNSGKSLLLFPEGTRKGKSIKPGLGMFAFNTKHDILPVYIENSDKLTDCFLFKKRLKIVFGEVISFSQFADLEANKENYQMISKYVYNKINELKNEIN